MQIDDATFTYGVNYSLAPDPVDRWGGAYLYLGPLPNEPNRFFDASGGIVFEVSGTDRLKISVNVNEPVGVNPDGTTKYRAVEIRIVGISPATPFVVVSLPDLLAAYSADYTQVVGVAVINEELDIFTPGTETVTVNSQGLLSIPTIPAVASGVLTDFSAFTGNSIRMEIPNRLEKIGFCDLSVWVGWADSRYFEIHCAINR